MRHEDAGEQIEYLYWARDRILAAAAALTESEFRANTTVTTRDLRSTLAHQLENEWAWRIMLSEGSFPVGDVLPTDFPSLDTLVDRWHREEREFRAWFDGLTDRDLAAQPPGEGSPLARWRCLLYVVNHGVQQFTEAAVLLTRLGHSPGEIGYLAFCSDPGAPVQSRQGLTPSGTRAGS
jgi:uncharacterized damage-inducible protein DinB